MKKKNAVGVRGIKMADDDFIEKVHYLAAGDDAIALYKEKESAFKPPPHRKTRYQRSKNQGLTRIFHFCTCFFLFGVL